MADQNRRYERNRSYRTNDQQFSQSQGDYDNHQEEQFEGSSSYGQDIDTQYGSRDNQMGEQGRRPVMYYEEVAWRAPRQHNQGRGAYGQRGDYDQGGRNGNDRYYGQDRDYGPSHYDNGLGYYTNESQGGRDFSRTGGRSYGARPGNGYGEQSYGRGEYDRGYDRTGYDRDRGFIDKAGDEIASWFGDEDAARRRRMDHRGSGPSNYTRSDERILEDACDCLTEDWQLDARNVEVTVQGGEVTLDGTVDSRSAKRRAEDVVHDVSGVGHVQNNLRVKDRDSYTDRDTATES